MYNGKYFLLFFFSAGGLWTIQNISTVVNKAVRKHCNHFKCVTNRQLYECLKSIQKPQSLCSHWRNTFKTKYNKIVSELSIEVVYV